MKRSRVLIPLSVGLLLLVSLSGLATESAAAKDSVPYFTTRSSDCWYETETVYGPWVSECTCYRCNWTHRCGATAATWSTSRAGQ